MSQRRQSLDTVEILTQASCYTFGCAFRYTFFCLMAVCGARVLSFSRLGDCFADQRRSFGNDSLLRKQVLAGKSLTPVTTMVPQIAAETLGKRLDGKEDIVSLIASFFDKFLIANFLEELRCCSIRDRTYRTTAKVSAVHPTADVQPVPTFDLFQCFFYLFAGPVATLQLPPGCYFTGSLCCAAASYPIGLMPGTNSAEELAMITEIWEGYRRMDDYDGFAAAMNDLYGQDLTSPKLGPIQEQSWLREADGLGPLARSDVDPNIVFTDSNRTFMNVSCFHPLRLSWADTIYLDIIITAQSNEEARMKIHQLVQGVLQLVGDAAVVATPNGDKDLNMKGLL